MTRARLPRRRRSLSGADYKAGNGSPAARRALECAAKDAMELSSSSLSVALQRIIDSVKPQLEMMHARYKKYEDEAKLLAKKIDQASFWELETLFTEKPPSAGAVAVLLENAADNALGGRQKKANAASRRKYEPMKKAAQCAWTKAQQTSKPPQKGEFARKLAREFCKKGQKIEARTVQGWIASPHHGKLRSTGKRKYL